MKLSSLRPRLRPLGHRIRPSVIALALPALLGSACAATGPPAPTEETETRFRFTYRAEVRGVPAEAERVRLWVPVPVDLPEQRIEDVRLRLTTPAGERELPLPAGPTTVLGARLLPGTIATGGASLCVETDGEPVTLELSYDVTRLAWSGGSGAAEPELARALAPASLVPLDGRVATVAASLPTPEDPRAAARALYDHTLERMRYEKPPGGGWGRGDAEWACDSRHGNCTDFHSYFLGLARAKGIPARFEIGFPIPGGHDHTAPVTGYHCWAYFWAGEEGWVPVDISEADKHPEFAAYYFGNLDPYRVTLTGGRDVLLEPAPESGPLNYFVLPHVEVDGAPWTDVKARFRRTWL